MRRVLRYGDGQIPISQIPLMAVFPRACYVQTETNPPAEKSDAQTDKVKARDWQHHPGQVYSKRRLLSLLLFISSLAMLTFPVVKEGFF